MPTKFMDEVPIRKGYKYDWPKITAELRKHPGKWAVVEGEGTVGTKGSADGAARSLRRGKRGGNPGDFEAVTRGHTVYARYRGSDDGQ